MSVTWDLHILAFYCNVKKIFKQTMNLLILEKLLTKNAKFCRWFCWLFFEGLELFLSLHSLKAHNLYSNDPNTLWSIKFYI